MRRRRVEVSEISEAAGHEAAIAIRIAVFVDEQGVTLEQEFDGLDESCRHLLARDDGRPAGTLRWRLLDDGTAKIERVAVLRAKRGGGIGQALLRAALARLAGEGVTRVRLHAQTHAAAFYRRLGFVAHGAEFVEDGIVHVAMLWQADG